MPRKKKRRTKSPAEVYTRLSLRIEDYRVRASAGINHYAHNPEYAWRNTEDEPLYEFETHLEITGSCIDPTKRAGDSYELTIYSEVDPENHIYWKLRDVQAIDEHRVPQYRTYRGKEIPVYRPPKGMGTLGKIQREPRWHGAIWAQPRYISDLLTVLGWDRELFMAIVERKVQRQRWIQGITVQTTRPGCGVGYSHEDRAGLWPALGVRLR